MLKLVIFLVAVTAIFAMPLKEERAINDAGCGLSKMSTYDEEPYIVGGTSAKKGQYPFMVSLVFLGIAHVCGATVIDDKWVLTAAHCFINGKNPNLYTVRIGRVHVSEYDPNAVDHKVQSLHIHTGFSMQTIKDDITLMKLKQPINFTNPYANRVCLPPTQPYETDNKIARIIGWGDMKNVTGKDLPTVLQQADITVKTEDVCVASYEDMYTHSTQVCAKSDTTAVCSGDSGGPILLKDDTGAWVQIGISSFVSGEGCLSPHPNVFTRVSYYKTWIENTIKANP